MNTNLKVILSALGVAALLASPATAKTARHHHAAPTTVNVPYDARASVGTYQSPRVPLNNNLNPDFQLGGEN